jgi:hypothetical protein
MKYIKGAGKIFKLHGNNWFFDKISSQNHKNKIYDQQNIIILE